MDSAGDAQAFPALLQETPLGIAHRRCCFARWDAPPPAPLSSHVTLVPFMGPDGLILRLRHGRWARPGGPGEPEERSEEALRRAWLEEAGGRLVTLEPVGAWLC